MEREKCSQNFSLCPNWSIRKVEKHSLIKLRNWQLSLRTVAQEKVKHVHSHRKKMQQTKEIENMV